MLIQLRRSRVRDEDIIKRERAGLVISWTRVILAFESSKGRKGD